MCGEATGAIVDLCEPEHHDIAKITTSPRGSVEKVWKETQQLMEQSERLVRIMTHVCSQQLSGVFRTVAKYSQGCWRGCSERQGRHRHHQQEEEEEPVCCEGRLGRWVRRPYLEEQGRCRWRGPGPRWRGGTYLSQDGNTMDSGGPVPPTTTTASTHHHHHHHQHLHHHHHHHHHHHQYHCCSPPPTPPTTRCRGGMPPHPSLLTLLLLLVVTLARFTEGCSSRSTPKPRPPSPTTRPNITFQTYACPPAYAAWYCLNGATCFTVKIGESILYNCECADGYMGQRCEFKDLDGSYLPAREKVLLETASIAGGATVACVLVFVVLFAVYVFMQKDKDKRCRDLDDGRDNDRQPFSGYQNPRPEIIRTISNPYARTAEELSHVEVQSTKPVTSPESSRDVNSSSNTCASDTQTNIHNAQDPS